MQINDSNEGQNPLLWWTARPVDNPDPDWRRQKAQTDPANDPVMSQCDDWSWPIIDPVDQLLLLIIVTQLTDGPRQPIIEPMTQLLLVLLWRTIEPRQLTVLDQLWYYYYYYWPIIIIVLLTDNPDEGQARRTTQPSYWKRTVVLNDPMTNSQLIINGQLSNPDIDPIIEQWRTVWTVEQTLIIEMTQLSQTNWWQRLVEENDQLTGPMRQPRRKMTSSQLVDRRRPDGWQLDERTVDPDPMTRTDRPDEWPDSEGQPNWTKLIEARPRRRRQRRKRMTDNETDPARRNQWQPVANERAKADYWRLSPASPDS